MKITVKGNTAKEKKFLPATDTQPAMLFFKLAENIKHRDGTEETIWHDVKVARGYAETTYRLLHGEEKISRYVQIEGRIVNKPRTWVTEGRQIAANNIIWADEITYLDNKWPKDAKPQPDSEEVPLDEFPEEPATELPPEIANDPTVLPW